MGGRRGLLKINIHHLTIIYGVSGVMDTGKGFIKRILLLKIRNNYDCTAGVLNA